MEKEISPEMELEQELDTLYRKVAVSDQRGDDAGPAPPPKPEGEGPEGGAIREPEEKPRKRRKARPAFSRSRGLAGGALFLVALGLAALFFWPTLYHYDALNLGGEVYPLRVNRLTGGAAYFDGLEWSRPPLLMPYRNPAPDQPKARVPDTVSSGAQEKPSGAAGRPGEPAAVKTRVEKGYAVQIRAFPENEREAALSFAEEAGKRLPDVRVETAPVEGRGTWHRILFGHFETFQDASGSMAKHGLMRAYPGSFIRKTSGE